MGVTDTPVVDRGALVASFDLSDHPVPTGREEAWRFTPLRRLRGLHDGSAVPTGPAGLEVSVDAAADVHRRDRRLRRPPRRQHRRPRRPGRGAGRRRRRPGPGRHGAARVRRRHARPWSRCAASGSPGRRTRACSSRSARSPRPSSSSTTPAPATHGTHRRGRRRGRRAAALHLAPRLGHRHGARRTPALPGRS